VRRPAAPRPPRPASPRPAPLSQCRAPPAGTDETLLRCEVGEYDAAAQRLTYSFAPAPACPNETADRLTRNADHFTLARELNVTDGARAPCEVGAPGATPTAPAAAAAPAPVPVQSAAAPARAALAAAAGALLAALLA
jgi:hypothetical protein